MKYLKAGSLVTFTTILRDDAIWGVNQEWAVGMYNSPLGYVESVNLADDSRIEAEGFNRLIMQHAD